MSSVIPRKHVSFRAPCDPSSTINIPTEYNLEEGQKTLHNCLDILQKINFDDQCNSEVLHLVELTTSLLLEHASSSVLSITEQHQIDKCFRRLSEQFDSRSKHTDICRDHDQQQQHIFFQNHATEELYRSAVLITLSSAMANLYKDSDPTKAAEYSRQCRDMSLSPFKYQYQLQCQASTSLKRSIDSPSVKSSSSSISSTRSSVSSPTCASCGIEKLRMPVCARCKLVYYCSIRCLKACNHNKLCGK